MSSPHVTKIHSQAPSTTRTSDRSSGVSTTRPPPFFPFARYTSIVGVHTSLLAFTALFLPRTSLTLLQEYSPFTRTSSFSSSTTSAVRLPTLSENPLRTTVWLCVGTLILQIWWASYIRSWSLDTRDLNEKVHDLAAERTEQKLQRQTWNNRRRAVRIPFLPLSRM